MTPPLHLRHERPHEGRRLLLISPYPPSRTGPAEYAAVFAAQCAARGFQIRVLTEQVPGAPAPPAPPPGVTIDPVWTPDQNGMRRLYAAARQDSTDVVHVNYSFTMYGGGFTGLLALFQFARLSRRRPLVVTLFDVLPKRELTAETLALYHVRAPPRVARFAVGSILKFLARVADRLVVQSQSTQRILELDYGIPPSKVAITELPGYPSGPRPAEGRTAVAAPPAAKVILYYGFLAPYKGIEVLLTAFARVRATDPHRPVRLVIAGTNHPRLTVDYAAELLSKAEKLGLGPEEVEFPGYVDEATTTRLFARSSLVVLPYLKTTGASGTLASAMGFERPVVVSDLAPLIAQLNGYPHSQVVPPGDVGALTESLRSVAEGRFVPRPPVAQVPGAVRHWAELVDRTADVYSSAIAARRRGFSPFGSELAADSEAPT
ncbi:MAG: glycosyltransferase [Thermoplasmata archaeon]|nr:glycosyltransferase [Thermoplasmata archaeon]